MSNRYDNYLSLLQELPLEAQKKVFEFAEFIYYENLYEEFEVLIHKYRIEEGNPEKIPSLILDYEKYIIWLMHIPENEVKRIQNLIRFLKIKYSHTNSLDEFLKYYEEQTVPQISEEDCSELKRRLDELKENPELAISGEEVKKEIEEMLGRKI